MIIATPWKSLQAVIDKVFGSPTELHNLEVDDDLLAEHKRQRLALHPEESLLELEDHSLAHLIWKKYGTPDERSTPSAIAPVDAAGAKHQAQTNEELRGLKAVQVEHHEAAETSRQKGNFLLERIMHEQRDEAFSAASRDGFLRDNLTLQTNRVTEQISVGAQTIARAVMAVAQQEREDRERLRRENRKFLTKAIAILVALLAMICAASIQGHGQVTHVDVTTVRTSTSFYDAVNQAIRVNVVAGGGAGGTSSSFGAAFPGTGTAVGVKDSTGANMTFLKADASNNLNVNCQTGCTAGGSFADSSAFTFGTTAVGNMSAVVDDVGTNAVAENSAGAVRMNGNRILYIDLSKTAANATAIKVDNSAVTQPVSGTFWQATQPVSGTVTANIGTAGTLATEATLSALSAKLPAALDGSGNLKVAVQNASIAVTGTFWQATQPVSGTFWQATQPVSGTFWQATQPVSAAALPLPTGASTLAEQQTQTTSLQLLDDVVGTASPGVAATKSQLGGTVYNTTAPAPTNGQQTAVQGNQEGDVLVAMGMPAATLSAWNSATALNTTQTICNRSCPETELVHLAQTTTLTAGAITFEVSYDNSNWVTIPSDAVLDPSSTTWATISLPYTVQASTNKPFMLVNKGWQGLRIKLSTAITGTGAVTPNYELINFAPVKALIALQGAAPWSVNQTQLNGNAVCTTDNGVQCEAPQATASATGALLACPILSAASTNSTSCKGSAGNFYGFEVYNTTTTVYYLRLYNSASAPTCSSATGFLRSIPIPPAGAAGNVGLAGSNQPLPVNYGTGIAYCITGGGSSTDNTNAATGIYGEIRYK